VPSTPLAQTSGQGYAVQSSQFNPVFQDVPLRAQSGYVVTLTPRFYATGAGVLVALVYYKVKVFETANGVPYLVAGGTLSPPNEGVRVPLLDWTGFLRVEAAAAAIGAGPIIRPAYLAVTVVGIEL